MSETPTKPLPQADAKRGDYSPGPVRRAWTVMRRWARDTFTREQLVSGLKQLAWVAPVTVLIWFYAEREQQIPDEVRFQLTVTSANPKVAVHLTEPRDGYVSVNLRAPRRRLEALRRELAMPVRFEIPSDQKPGSHQFPTRLVVDRDSRFDGVTLTGNEQVSVEVEPIEEQKIPVTVREEDRARYAQAVFLPDKVTVKMPRRLWIEAGSNSPIVAYADLSSLSDQTPGNKSNIPGLRVSVPTSDPDSVTIEPSTVSAASLVVRARDREYAIPSLTLLESVPTTLRNDFDVKLGRYNIFNVVVSGPAAIIDEIERTEGKGIKALVSIDNSFTDPNAIGQEQDANVWFTLPEGVKVKSKVEPVKVTITNRSPR